MAVTSSIVEEKQGRGHTDHGNGKGKGHEKHADKAMADGVYEMEISGISHVKRTAGDQVSAQVELADGSKLNTEVRFGAIQIVDAPGSQDNGGALLLDTDTDNGRLRVNVEYDADNRVTLGNFDTLEFDYYIESSSRPDVIPVIRLVIDADGNLGTTGDRGELVFEYSYQGLGSTTQDSWQSANLAGSDWMAWQRSFGQNRDQIVNITEFSDWADADGFTPAGGLNFDEGSVVLGVSVALGSGNGANEIYMDNLRVAGVTYDFFV